MMDRQLQFPTMATDAPAALAEKISMALIHYTAAHLIAKNALPTTLRRHQLGLHPTSPRSCRIVQTAKWTGPYFSRPLSKGVLIETATEVTHCIGGWAHLGSACQRGENLLVHTRMICAVSTARFSGILPHRIAMGAALTW